MSFSLGVALALEGISAVLAFVPRIGMALWFALHLLSAGVVLSDLRKREDNRLMFTGALWLFAPLLGPLVLAVESLFWRFKRSDQSQSLADYLDSLEVEQSYVNSVSVRLSGARAEHSRLVDPLSEQWRFPYLEIMRTSGIPERKRAIARLRSSRTREAIKQLRTAQRDGSREIRHLATAALSSIEQEFNLSLQNLKAEIARKPDRIELRNEMSHATMLFFYLGLVPESTSRIYLRHALEHVIISLQLDANQPAIWILLGRITLKDGNPHLARTCFEKAIEGDPRGVNARFWHAEASFRLGLREDVIDQVKAIRKVGSPFMALDPVLRYWESFA